MVDVEGKMVGAVEEGDQICAGERQVVTERIAWWKEMKCMGVRGREQGRGGRNGTRDEIG